MKQIVLITLSCAIMAFYGCSPEKVQQSQQKIPAITLTPADKEMLMAFQKDLLNIENLTDKAIKLAGDELKNVIKGGGVSISLPAIIEKAKIECQQAGESLAQKKVPGTLSPETRKLLEDAKIGLIAAYKAYAESFDAVRGFITDKNPMALLEYRKKSSEAQKLYEEAAGKFKKIMTAAGVAQ